VMLCSSWFESLSMVALETMSMERPIVSTNVGGPAETVIDGTTGYLVPPRNSQALAERAIMLLKDPVLSQRIGKAARTHVIEHFSAHRYADRIGAVLDDLHQPAETK
jgi:glycosyltransferase involved in cell wall biosynthesis